jgi:hypothetical protein
MALEQRLNPFQAIIVVGGPKRGGKTTFGRGLERKIRELGGLATMLDVDLVKAGMFGKIDAKPDTDRSTHYHRAAVDAMWDIAAKTLIKDSVTPILVGGHNSEFFFEKKAVPLAEEFKLELAYILLEPPSLEEAGRRIQEAQARADSGEDDQSDMRNFEDPAIQKSFLDSAARTTEMFAKLSQDRRITMILQSTPTTMLSGGIQFLRNRLRGV